MALIFSLVPAGLIFALSRFIDFPKPTTRKVYPSIDIARALAVLFVVLLHARGYSGLATSPPQNLFDLFARNGQFGVEIFYVLSAFTLSFSLMQQARSDRAHPLANFWIRRIARILPALLILFAAITAFKIWMVGELYDVRELLFRLLTMSYIFDDTVRLSLNHTVWWSVATEFQFYILMPILFAAPLAWADGDKGRSLLIAIGVPLAGYSVALLSTHLPGDRSWLPRSLLYHAIPFSAGIGLACLARLIPDSGRFLPASARLGLLAVSVACLIATVTFFDQIDQLGHKIGIVAIVSATCFAIIAGRLFDMGSVCLANMPIMRSVGILSFLIYLLHVPMMQAIRWLGGSSLAGSAEGVYAIMVVGSVVASWLIGLVLHRLIETPVMKRTAKMAAHPAGVFLTYAYVLVLMVAAFFALALF